MNSRWLVAPVVALSIASACSSSTTSNKTVDNNPADGGSSDTDSGPGTTGTTATATGNENGNPVNLTYALAIFGTQSPAGSPITNYAFIVLTTRPVTCAELQTDAKNNVRDANNEVLDLTLESESSSSSSTPPAITAQKYTVAANPSPDENGNIAVVAGKYTAYDATCASSSGTDSAETGSITLTAASATAITGSFDITFQSGAVLKGTFTPQVCAGVTLADISSSNTGEDAGTLTCQQ